MNIFYCPTAVLNAVIELDEQESHHAHKVLRKNIGDTIAVFDGKGHLYSASIAVVNKRSISVVVQELLQQTASNKPRLHLAVAPPKNLDRLEWLVEKATEIGVDDISLIICQNSERREVRLDRIEKVIMSAAKQSLKFNLPVLNECVSFPKFMAAQAAVCERKFIAFCHEKAEHLKSVYSASQNALILIGPEGDFTQEEVHLAAKNGFEMVSLGESRLRLETAAIYATTVFQLMNEK
jgi:16S rRNA (uracil1498-N3)-methyltransferase